MKLAIVCQRYDPAAGAGRFVARTLPALERAGFEPTLIAREAEGWGARRLVRIDPFHVGKLWGERSFADAARKAWQREGFDLVQSHEPIPGCHVYRPEEGIQESAILKETIEHPRLRAVLCPSKRMRDELRRAYRIAPDKLHVLYGGVDLEHFHPRERERLRGLARAEIGCRPRDTVFLALDGHAVAAMAAAADEAFWLVAAGKPSKQGSKRVHFVEPPDDLRSLYAAADCLVLPGAYDPALEALAMGLPVIASARSAAAELIEPALTGWLCEPDDGAGLAHAMKAADAAVAAGSVHAAARTSAERFGADAMASQLAAIYASL